MVKKLKISMVNAGRRIKGYDRKKYAKIRYLFENLLHYIEGK